MTLTGTVFITGETLCRFGISSCGTESSDRCVVVAVVASGGTSLTCIVPPAASAGDGDGAVHQLSGGTVTIEVGAFDVVNLFGVWLVFLKLTFCRLVQYVTVSAVGICK